MLTAFLLIQLLKTRY